MTDKEMAEKEYENLSQKKIEHYCDKAIYVTGFLDGLKLGRPQWHDLRKDPTDLPKENELYLVFGYTNKREKFYELDVFDPTEEVFLGCGEYVYAWCELPTFNKE